MNIEPQALRELTQGIEHGEEGYKLLNRLSEESVRGEPERALYLAKRALCIATACKDAGGRAESYRNIGVARLHLAAYGSAMLNLRKAVRLYRKANDRIGESRSLSNIGSVCIAQGEYMQALEEFQQALAIGQALHERQITNMVLSNLGVLYLRFGDCPKSLDYHYQSLRIKEEIQAPIAGELNNIAGVYFTMGNYDKALQVYLECLKPYREIGDRYGEAIALGNIGETMQALGQWEPGHDYLQQALKLLEELDDKGRIAHILQSIAYHYSSTGDNDRALQAYTEAHELVSALKSKSLVSQSLLNIATLHIKCGRLNEARLLLDKALPIAIEQGDRESQMECHQQYADIYERWQEGMKALWHFKQYASIREDLFGQEKRNAVAEIRTRAELETIEREREILRLKADRLESEMEHKAKELTSLAMQLVQKNELLDSISAQIREAEGVRSQSLATLLRQIESNKSSAREWEQFEQQFQNIHHDFIDRLARDNPSLSPTELKVCALLKINLSTKEIANILCSSVRTVEDHRYRIRNKLGLKSAANLVALIAAM